VFYTEYTYITRNDAKNTDLYHYSFFTQIMAVTRNKKIKTNPGELECKKLQEFYNKRKKKH